MHFVCGEEEEHEEEQVTEEGEHLQQCEKEMLKEEQHKEG